MRVAINNSKIIVVSKYSSNAKLRLVREYVTFILVLSLAFLNEKIANLLMKNGRLKNGQRDQNCHSLFKTRKSKG